MNFTAKYVAEKSIAFTYLYRASRSLENGKLAEAAADCNIAAEALYSAQQAIVTQDDLLDSTLEIPHLKAELDRLIRRLAELNGAGTR